MDGRHWYVMLWSAAGLVMAPSFECIATQPEICTVDAVIFLVDPLDKHPHDPDIQSLMRLCNVHNVPLATNIATADSIIAAIAMQAIQGKSGAQG